jgi:tRNA threonylcarbamoyladenosine modification (KEOPS) complex  Pcc1 subunit
MTSPQSRFLQVKKENIISGLEAKIETILREDLARVAYLALKPDLDKAPKSNLLANISYDKDKLIINIRGDDISQLRAGINSYLRLINVIIKTLWLNSFLVGVPLLVFIRPLSFSFVGLLACCICML